MALNNINIVAQKVGSDIGNKVVVTIWAEEADWSAATTADDDELGAQVMDAVVAAIESVAL